MISVVIPLFNEEESIRFLYKQITQYVPLSDKNYEIIFIDDGSNDASLDILRELAQKDNKIRIFSFRKNQGKAEALTLGFQKASGDYIVTLDADLQDKPSEIGKLLKKSEEGWDIVSGWRKNRRDPLKKIISSKLFNFFARVFWKLQLHDYNCGLKLYKQEAAKSLRLYGGLHRFIPLIAYQNGFSVTEVPIDHQERKFGKSKYGFSKLWKDLPDIFTMLFLIRYSKRPLHFFGLIGSFFFLVGFVILVYLSILRFQGEAIGRRPLLLFGVLLVLSGFQIFFTGFLAELITNISQRNDQQYSLKYKTE